MTNHVMVDLEAADIAPTAAIVSIGAVVFSGPRESAAFYVAVDLHSSLAAGLTLSEETMDWWGRQSAAARVVFDDPSRVRLRAALLEFSNFIRPRDDVKVWGNGASFDNAVLQVAYKLTGIPLPWKFWNDRCYRTAVAGKARRIQTGTYHNALDDARSQAAHLLAVAPGAVR